MKAAALLYFLWLILFKFTQQDNVGQRKTRARMEFGKQPLVALLSLQVTIRMDWHVQQQGIEIILAD